MTSQETPSRATSWSNLFILPNVLLIVGGVSALPFAIGGALAVVRRVARGGPRRAAACATITALSWAAFLGLQVTIAFVGLGKLGSAAGDFLYPLVLLWGAALISSVLYAQQALPRLGILSVAAVALMAGFTALTYARGWSAMERALANGVNPIDVPEIRAEGRRELLALLQVSGPLVLASASLLITGRWRGRATRLRP